MSAEPSPGEVALVEILRNCARDALEMFAGIHVTKHELGESRDEVKEALEVIQEDFKKELKGFKAELKEQVDIVLKNFWDDLEATLRNHKKELNDELWELKEELKAELKVELMAELVEEVKVVQDQLAASQKEIMRLSGRQETFEVETQQTHAELRSVANARKTAINDLAWSFQDLRTQEIDRLYETHDFEAKTEIALDDLHTSIEEIHSELGKQKIILEDVQVDVAEATIDTSHLEDEQTDLNSRVEALTKRDDLIPQQPKNFQETVKSRLQTLETGLKVLQKEQRELKNAGEQIINIPGRGRRTPRHVTPEHDRGAYAAQIDDHEHHHGPQLDNQVFDHQRGPQDFESDDELEVSDFTHTVETHDDDQAMMDVQDHESVTLHDHDQDMDDGERKVWLDDHGILQTNDQDPDDTWNELEATWDIQKAKFEAITKEEGVLAWMSVDFDKYSKKCLWSAIHSRTHYWTNSEAGSFACKACANNRVICFGNNNGRWEALPLPDEVVEDNPSIKQKYISYRNTISKSRQAIGVWPDS